MHQFWDPLNENERKLFIEQLDVHYYKNEETLNEYGSQPLSLYYLLKGKVTIYRKLANGQRQIIYLVNQGCMFGYSTAFTNSLRKSMAVAGNETTVAQIPIELVRQLIRQNPDFAMAIVHDMARLLDLSVNHTINVTRKHIRGRLAEILLRLLQKYGTERDGKTLAIYISRKDLACVSNMTSSNAIRTLSAFSKEGLIAIEGRRIQFLDLEKLKHVAKIG